MASCSGFLILVRPRSGSTHQRFNFFLERFAGLFVGRNDQDGVIASDGASGLWKFGGVHCGGERLRAAGGRLQDKEILRGPNVGKKFAEGTSQGRQAVGFFRERGGGAIAFV